MREHQPAVARYEVCTEQCCRVWCGPNTADVYRRRRDACCCTACAVDAPFDIRHAAAVVGRGAQTYDSHGRFEYLQVGAYAVNEL